MTNTILKPAPVLLLALTLVLSVFIPMMPTRAAGSWQGQYWNLDPEDYPGDEGPEFIDPDFPEGSPDLTRTDPAIDFMWEEGSPHASINDNGFIVRWTGNHTFTEGWYVFGGTSDDGMRVYIDDELVIDEWYLQGFGQNNSSYGHYMTAGSHEIVVEYYENNGGAGIYFSYTPVDPAKATEVLGQVDFNTNSEDGAGPNNFGFDAPYAIDIDRVNHRLFVADEEAARILVFNLNNDNQLVDKTADFVLGQADFSSQYCNRNQGSPAANTLCEPYDLTYDSANNRLFVSDPGNNRVLVYDTGTIINGEPAVNVLGEEDFTSNNCCGGADDDTFSIPRGVVVNPAGTRLFVTDRNNHRVLMFDVGSITNGQAAINVLGQEDLDDGDAHCNIEDTLTAYGFCSPTNLEYDAANNRLFVSDSNNLRVLAFDMASISNGEDAVNVLGQEDLTTYTTHGITDHSFGDARSLSFDPAGKRLFVADAGSLGVNRVLVFDLDEFVDGESAVNVLGQANFTSGDCNRDWETGVVAANTLCGPYGVHFDPDNNLLYTADSWNSRAVVYNTDGITDGEDAVDVLGQSDLQSDHAYGVSTPNNYGFDEPFTTAVDSVNNRLFVTDRFNNRVVVFNLNGDGKPLDNAADYVIGQEDFESGDCNRNNDPDQDTLCDPMGLAFDSVNQRLFVTDKNNNRILVFDVTDDNIENGMDADYVLGQVNFEGSSSNPGGRSASTLNVPFGLAMDDQEQFLYVADRNNHRIIGYNVHPDNIDNNLAATRVVGQANFTSGSCNRGGEQIQTANTICRARGVAINPATKQLFVSDGSDDTTHRVLAHNLNGFTNGQDAGFVLGQEDFEGEDCNRGNEFYVDAGMVCSPLGLAVDVAHDRLYVVDEWNERILVFDTSEGQLANGANAIGVIGQLNFNGHDCNWDASPNEYTLCNALGVGVNQENGDVWVADTWNNRVLGYAFDDLNFESGTNDTDADGIPDDVENAGPNGGDGNDDGTPDSEQSHVASLVSPVSGKYVTLALGDDDCEVTSISITAESSNAVQDAGYDYQSGLLNFTANCGTTEVSLYYHGISPADLTVRKHNPGTNAYFTITEAVKSALSSPLAGTLVTYTIVDNGPLDLDSEEGVIADPVGLGSAVVGAPNTGLGGRN